MRGKGLVIMGVLVAAVGGAAAVLSNRQPAGIDGAGLALYPGLEQRLNDTASVTVTGDGKATTIVRHDGRWMVQERGGYPADVNQVRQLLVGVAALTRIEPKTTNDKLYAEIGVDDPARKGSHARLVAVKDQGGSDIASLLVGDQRPGTGDPLHQEYFVRKSGDKQSWLVSGGRLVVDAAPQHWLDNRLTSIDKKRIRRVTVRQADGKEVAVYRDTADAPDFSLADRPKKAKLKSQFTLNDVAATMGRLTLSDVHRPQDVTLSDKPVFTATLETFDGLRLTLTGFSAKPEGEAKYITLAAAYDPSLVAAAPQAKVEEKDKKPAKARDVKKEADDLEARFKPWVYELPAFQIGNIDKTQADLLESDKPSKTAAAHATKP